MSPYTYAKMGRSGHLAKMTETPFDSASDIFVSWINAAKLAIVAAVAGYDRKALATYVATALAAIIAITHSQNFPFIFLFAFRYLRLMAHMISFWLYKPTPIPARPSIFPRDCTVIIPTIDPENADFIECLESVQANSPGAILIVTVGLERLERVRQIAAAHGTNIQVTATNFANKRGQVCHAVPHVRTQITVLADDHVFWPSTNFLKAIIAPFEDPLVATVGTNKRVRRDKPGFTFAAFWNLLGALYLERHNFELAATNNIDGGVFVISGRTSAHRTSILQDPAFVASFTNERFFFNLFGPLNADDDNFITRWEVSRGWKIRFQYSDDALIETTLGEYPKFLSQCLRWVRTTWRSNSASLFTDRTVWRRQPWCVYAVYITGFFNFALFMDAALLCTLSLTTFGGDAFAFKCLAAWMFASKLVKPFPHFWRRPKDLVFLPGYILFGYYHSLLKLYAGLTFWNVSWGGRDLASVNSSIDKTSSSTGSSATLSGSPYSPTDSGYSSDTTGDYDPSNSELNFIKTLPTTSRRGFVAPTISTPWGPVRTRTPEHLPANVLESSMPHIRSRTRSSASKPAAGKAAAAPEIKAKRTWINVPYARSWVRGEDCERLHDQGRNLMRGRCVTGEARDIGL